MSKITGGTNREVKNIYTNSRAFAASINSVRDKVNAVTSEEELKPLEAELDALERTASDYQAQPQKSRREKAALGAAFSSGMQDIKTLRTRIESTKHTFETSRQWEKNIGALRGELGAKQKLADLQDFLSTLNAKYAEVRANYEIPFETRNILQIQLTGLISDVKGRIRTKTDEIAMDKKAAEALVIARQAQKLAADPSISEDEKRHELSQLNDQIRDKTTELSRMSIELKSEPRRKQALDLIFQTREGVAAENNRLVLKYTMDELSEIKRGFDQLPSENLSRKRYAETVSVLYGEMSYFSETIKSMAREAVGMTDDVQAMMEQCDQLLSELEPQLTVTTDAGSQG